MPISLALGFAETSESLERPWYRLRVSSFDSRDSNDPSRPAPMVVVVILNWNNLPDTLECVESVLRSDYKHLAVLVVDNNSLEDPTTVLRDRYPSVCVLRTARNLGYGGGNNVGIRWAIDRGAVHVLLLNNDAIVSPDMVQRLVSAVDTDDRIGMVTPRVFYYDRPAEVYWDGGVIDWETGDTPHDSASLRVEDGVIASEWLDGCALLARVATIHEIGLLDDRYFLYFEDAEWSVRASRQGWKTAVVTMAHAWHKVSRSTGGFANPAVRFYYVRNQYRFLRTHRPSGGRLWWRLQYFSRICWDYIGIRHEREAREAVIAAFLSLLSGSWGPYESSGGSRRLVLLLDTLLIPATRCARPVKRLLSRLHRGKGPVTSSKARAPES